MTLNRPLSNLTGKFLNSCVKNNGMFLFLSAAASWILASATHTVGLLVNKKIDDNERKFLVPQEILDGTANILTYAAITFPLMSIAKSIALKKFPSNPKAIEGANTIAAVAGGVISSNLVTPILRNKTGVHVKNFLEANINKKSQTSNRPQSPLSEGNLQKQRISMANYMSFTKNMPLSSSLKI